MENNYRFEKKFIIPYEYKNIIIEKIFSNPYRFQESYERRIINNIYFDDLGQNSARDNINGNSIRSKFRLRWYGEKYGKIKSIFERKYKKGNVGGKNFYEIEDFIFSKNSNRLSIRNQIEKNCKNILCKESIKYINAVLLNSYTRRYFTSFDKKVRITLDYGIENYRINNISHHIIYNHNNQNKIIMEIKYENNLSIDISSICQYFPLRQQRFSKFIYGLIQANS